MGKLINGPNGPIQGKVGSVIGSSWKGIPYVKGPYKKRTKKVSKKELGNRNKFSQAQYWLRPLLIFVREGFKGYSLRSEGFVAAKSCLLLNSFEGTAPDIKINPALVKVSFGSLPPARNMQAEKIKKDLLQFTWDTSDVNAATGHDQIMMMAYDVENSDAYFNITGQFRKNGTDTLSIDGSKGKTYHIYAAFTAADRNSQSHSIYLGEIST